MGILNWFGKRGFDVYEMDSYDIKNVGDITIPEKLTNKNAFLLANSVAEMFFPVDFYADRISKLRFFIANKTGKEVNGTELKRFVSDINPIWSFSDLIYNYVFSYLSDGNAINYLSVPSIYQNINPSTISRWDILQPNLVTIYEYSNTSLLNINSLNELIQRVYYNDGGAQMNQLDSDKIIIHNFGLKRRSDSMVLSDGLLWKANKSIDTLLAVYSARYNVYRNNGMAGILSKKQSSSGTMQTSLIDGNKREEILKDINERHGIVGRKNIWGISGVPVEFVKTLATISELMPFDETLDDAIKIASAFQIPPVLVPRKDQSTFDNQKTAEQTVWENGLLSLAKTVCQNLTKMFGIGKYGNQITFDESNVSALMQNEEDSERVIKMKLENLEKLKAMNPELNIEQITNEIFNQYGS